MWIEFGQTEIKFSLEENFLSFHIEDVKTKSNQNITVPITTNPLNLPAELDTFLLNYLAHTSNFIGEPTYESSIWYTQEEFNRILCKAKDIITKRRADIILKDTQNAFIIRLRDWGLDPIPTLEDPSSWEANCPSKRNHKIMVDSSTNTWGCGYCRKKGGIIELTNWYRGNF